MRPVHLSTDNAPSRLGHRERADARRLVALAREDACCPSRHRRLRHGLSSFLASRRRRLFVVTGGEGRERRVLLAATAQRSRARFGNLFGMLRPLARLGPLAVALVVLGSLDRPLTRGLSAWERCGVMLGAIVAAVAAGSLLAELCRDRSLVAAIRRHAPELRPILEQPIVLHDFEFTSTNPEHLDGDGDVSAGIRACLVEGGGIIARLPDDPHAGDYQHFTGVSVVRFGHIRPQTVLVFGDLPRDVAALSEEADVVQLDVARRRRALEPV